MRYTDDPKFYSETDLRSLDTHDFSGIAHILLTTSGMEKLTENNGKFSSQAHLDLASYFPNNRLDVSLVVENINFAVSENHMTVPGIGDIMFTYFHGRAPVMIQLDGIIDDLNGTYGKLEFVEVYKHVLRSSMVARTGIVPHILFRKATVSGPFHNLALSEVSTTQGVVRFTTQVYAFSINLFSDVGGIPEVEVTPIPISYPTFPETEPESEPEQGDTDTQALRKSIVNWANHYINQDIPYVWGGDSPETGFDCSGFTQYVYNKAGIEIPKYSGAQYSKGKTIPIDKIKPGDLIFIKTNGGSNNHVGIYLGNDKIANALNEEKGLVISDMDDYWTGDNFWGVKTYIS